MPFVPAFKNTSTDLNQALWFVFYDDHLLVKANEDNVQIPQTRDLTNNDITPIHRQYLGSLDGLPCYAAELTNNQVESNQFSLQGLRMLFFSRLEEELIWIAGRAHQLVDWNRNHQFCGRCGHSTTNEQNERAKICTQCGLINYPRLSPAVIVAVRRGNRILLANNKRFKSSFYSVLAGFVEPGENLEECVAREIKEEVGISVKNIRYFASQPWPFPNSLMVAFFADYAGGEITPDKSEIRDAGWFSPSKLPSIPPKITIARQMIDWFVDSC